MNQPASKEPTMDEILSSIRQIIADDDEAAAQKMPATRMAPSRPLEAVAPKSAPQINSTSIVAPADIDPFADDDEDDVSPLALSPEQIIQPDPAEAEPFETFAEEPAEEAPELVVPDDVAFEQEKDEDPVLAFAPTALAEKAEATANRTEEPEQPSFSKAAPMPDVNLSSDLADELLEPATSAAVRSAMSKLNTPKLTPELAIAANGLTIEGMIREMLRPMLKDWLDENLPSMVERIVAQEIERVSRGG